MAIDIKKYDVPLKKPMPTLQYDIALYCELLKGIIPGRLPEYLSEYSEKLNAFIKLKDKLEPKEEDFPGAYRVYLIDYRLNVLFASHDTTGEIATWFSKYGARCKDIEKYYYGDGLLFGDVLPLPGQSYNKKEMQDFKKQFGFIPIEELAMTAALVIDGDEVLERRAMSQYQTALLMEKFRRNNHINWDKRTQLVADEHLSW